MTATTWQAVQAEALRRIRSREWPPGARIPDEEVLARELGCARATVNRALRELGRGRVAGPAAQGGHPCGTDPGAQGDL